MKETKDFCLELCNMQIELGFERALIPGLVGKTSVGKTYYVEHPLSEALGLPVVKLLLQ